MELQEEKNFVLRCEKDLPKMLMVDGVNYKLYAHGLLSGGFRISYGEFDGNFFNWENKPIDLFYNIVEILPSTKEYKEGELQDVSIYKTNIDDVISDCLDKMKTWHNGLYTELNEITSRETQNSDKSQKPQLNIPAVMCALPCPFCGSDTEIETNTFGDSMTEYYRVNCKQKGHSLDWWSDTIDEAISVWNERQ